MKIKHLLIGLFAVAATVACKQDEPVETPSLEVSQESLELAAKAGEASFDVTANLAWTATADQDWVNLEPASGDASKNAVTVTVTAENNTANEARTATVTVTAGELTKTVALTQAAAEAAEPEPVLTLAVNEASVAADATSYEVALTANCAWEAEATDGVTVNPATGEGDATVTLRFAANEVTSPVTHSVTFSAGEGLTAVLTLTQAAAEAAEPEPVLTLAANEASVAADATSYEVALTANCAWTAIASEGVTVDPANGEGDAAVTLAFAANEVTSPVTHTVTFSAGEDVTAVLTLTQAAAEPVLTLAANEASVAADATSYEVALTANCAWTAIASEGVTVDPANGEGDAAVTLAFAANEVTSPVTHTVTFSAGEDVTAVLTLTQAAAIPVGISSIKDKITSATEVAFTAKLEDAIVTYVNGKNAYIQDADAGILIYQDGHGLVAGNKINGVISGKATSYNNLREITSVDLSSATIESGAEIPVTEITVADLLADGGYDKYESMRVKVVNVEVIIANSKVAQGENSCDLYMKNKSAVGYDQYSLVTVTAYPGKYNSTIQLNVWEDAEFLGISRTVLTGFGDIEVPVGEKKANKATASSGATVVYTSSSESVASVDQDGNVTGVAEGTATVTVRVDAYNGYPAAEATYKVTVLPAGTEVAKAWTLVTNVSALAAGDKIIIVATNTNQALSEVQNTNNRGQVAVAKSDNTVTFDTAVQEITLEAGTVAGTFAFNVGESNYLYAASSSKNYLKTGTTKNENASWKIEIASSGVATVKAQGDNTRNWLRHNSTNGLFACYSSGQNDVSIYKYQ